MMLGYNRARARARALIDGKIKFSYVDITSNWICNRAISADAKYYGLADYNGARCLFEVSTFNGAG